MVDLVDACWKLPEREIENIFVGDYAPEMGETPAFEQELASWYQYLIGILSRVVEMGRIDIITEVSIIEY